MNALVEADRELSEGIVNVKVGDENCAPCRFARVVGMLSFVWQVRVLCRVA